MRHLIVCCDGTWSTPENPSVTNVSRVHEALADKDAAGRPQVRYYQPGVGTVRYRFLGGGFGLGLSENILDAYRWLTANYQPDDRVWLFGFSRGAYTVRSLAGMISSCGLIDTGEMDEETARDKVESIYANRYRRRGPDRAWRQGLSFRYDPDDHAGIPVHFIGVWDTVGALGIPNYLGWLNLLDPTHTHNFHDLRLNPYIRRGRHAVALDERRAPYVPSLWAEPFGEAQDVQQVWFPGVHSDVGGGHRQTGLSDGALKWMVDQVKDDLAFHQPKLDEIRPDPLDVLHSDDRGVINGVRPMARSRSSVLREFAYQPRPRAVPLIIPSTPNVHSSAHHRQQHTRYRPTKVLAPGQAATVDVHANRTWNETGLYLHAGEYGFAAQGQWQDDNVTSGPDGTHDLSRFNPFTERLRLVGTLLTPVQQLFRRVTRNKVASFLGTPREANLPWMFLVGVVANDAILTKDEDPNAHESIPIGTGTRFRVTKSGYLYAYANNAWGCYANNKGTVHLTVTRIS